MAHTSTGLYEEINDVIVTTKNHRRRFVNVDMPAQYEKDNARYGHEVIQVPLKNSEKYPLDIAGAQYGQFTPVIPWVVYVRSHVRDVVKYLDFRATRERMTSPTYCNGSTAVQMKMNFSKLMSESMDANQRMARSNYHAACYAQSFGTGTTVKAE